MKAIHLFSSKSMIAFMLLCLDEPTGSVLMLLSLFKSLSEFDTFLTGSVILGVLLGLNSSGINAFILF